MRKIILSLILIFAFSQGVSAYPNIVRVNDVENYYTTGTDRNDTLQYWYNTADGFTAGDGSEDNPYVISTWGQLRLLDDYGCGASGKGRYFTIDTDLYRNMLYSDKSGNRPVYFKPIGTGDAPFEGILDAAGHHIDANSDKIFDVIGENGVVRNVIKYSRVGIAGTNLGLIENCRVLVEGPGENLTDNAGGIAGENTGIIRKCTVHGTRENDQRSGYENYNISATGSGIGGIVGYNKGGVIEECHANLLIEGRESSRAVGGIAGDNSGGVIRNCYTDYDVHNKGSETGGIVGRLYDGVIENCIATGIVSGSANYSGRLVGAVYNDSQIINCYAKAWDNENNSMKTANWGYGQRKSPTIGNATPDNADYGMSAKDMRIGSTYKGFDFENVWIMREDDYPRLKIMYDFPDIYTHWARDYIEFLAERGVIAGYEDGTFRPDENVTKAEMLMMAIKAVKEKSDEHEMPFTDVPEWLSKYIGKMYFYNDTKEMLNNIAVSETKLGADNDATRLEAAYIAGTYISDRSAMPEGFKFTLKDIDKIPEWAYDAVYYSKVVGYEDGTFRPDNTITRAEAAVIIKKLYESKVWKNIYSY